MQKTPKSVPILVYLTCPTKTVAQRIAKTLVTEKLAACANVLGQSESYYRWKGKQERSNEYIVIVKTVKRLFREVEKRILQVHPYECPCIVAIKIEDGYKKYLEWARMELR